MITLHFYLQPQYKHELFHINFTSFYCTGRYELNKLTSLPMCGFIAQLAEHRTGIAEVTGSNPVEALIFFRLLLSNCLNWKIYCDDHISLSFSWVFTTISVKREATFCHSLSFWWLWHIFDSFLSTFCWLFSMNCMSCVFLWIVSFLLDAKK